MTITGQDIFIPYSIYNSHLRFIQYVREKNTLNVHELCTVLFIVIKLAHNLVNLLSDLSYSGFLLLLVSYFMFTLPHSFDNRDKE